MNTVSISQDELNKLLETSKNSKSQTKPPRRNRSEIFDTIAKNDEDTAYMQEKMEVLISQSEVDALFK